MMKRALIFSGGGAKGAYEVGVWKALKELNIKCDIVTGTSIGSINGALYTQGDIDVAIRLWQNLNINMVFEDKIKYSNEIELIKNYLEKVKDGGLEPSKLKENLEKSINIEKVYNSKIDYGLATVEYPTLRLVELSKKEIPKNKFIDYLIASSTVYPVFKLKKIDDTKYIDGGFRKTMPIDLATKLGATNYIIVNISTTNKMYKPKRSKNIIYIKPNNDIGQALVFDGKVAEKSIRYGYNDTMKVMKKLFGKRYTFKNIDNYYRKNEVFYSKTIYLNTLEYLGTIFLIDDSKIYKISNFNEILKKKIDKEMYDKEMKFKDILSNKEKVIFIYHAITNNSINKIYDIIKHTKEYKAAYYLAHNMKNF